MDTNTMYIEHYIDLHNYISDNIYKLNNSPSEYLCELTLIEAMIGVAGITVITNTLYSLITNFNINSYINKLEKFKNNFKEISLTKEEIDSIINNKKYFDLKLTNLELEKIINDLNKIDTTDSFYDEIIKNSTKIQKIIKLIAFFMNLTIEIINKLTKQSTLNQEKIKQLIAIIKINNKLNSLNINKNFNYKKFNSIFDDIYNIEPINQLSFINAKNFNINNLKTIINNKFNNIDKIKQLFNNIEKNNDLGSELTKLLNGKKLADEIENNLKNISLIIKLFSLFKLFLQLSTDIINKK